MASSEDENNDPTLCTYKFIPLRNMDKKIIGHAKIDEDDYEAVSKYVWRKVDRYCKAKVGNDDIFMHQLLMGKAPNGHVIDHYDGDGLNNTRANLRIVTKSQNTQNRTVNIEGTSKYRGVYLHKRGKKWASCSSNDYLGAYDTEEEAARVFDTYTLLKYGAQARTNGLVKYENIKDLDMDSLLKKKEKRDLPDNIRMKRKSFMVHIKYKDNVFHAVVATLEIAINKLEEFKKTIEEIKEEEANNHNAMEIIRNEDGVAIIPIVNKSGEIVAHAMVSDDKWHMCMKYSWFKNDKNYCKSYADGKHVRMHRFIMNAPTDTIVHHKDGNPLNNTTENLICTNHTVNNHCKIKKKNATSQYFGVWYNKTENRWASEIRKNNVRYNVGRFDTEIEAAKAYNKKAYELYGDDAKLNVIP